MAAIPDQTTQTPPSRNTSSKWPDQARQETEYTGLQGVIHIRLVNYFHLHACPVIVKPATRYLHPHTLPQGVSETRDMKPPVSNQPTEVFRDSTKARPRRHEQRTSARNSVKSKLQCNGTYFPQSLVCPVRRYSSGLVRTAVRLAFFTGLVSVCRISHTGLAPYYKHHATVHLVGCPPPSPCSAPSLNDSPTHPTRASSP